MKAKKKNEKPCKHEWKCEILFARDIMNGMRCCRCCLERPFTQSERQIYNMGRRQGRANTWNSINERFSTIMHVELQTPLDRD